MIDVSNTTPLRYLIAIGQDDLLGRLFEKVFVPTGVHEELTDPRTPEAVRRNILALPAWLEIRAVRETRTTEFPVTLHRGEREAILLAETLRADVLSVDEQIGRTIALSRNIPLSGTLGVLERADLMVERSLRLTEVLDEHDIALELIHAALQYPFRVRRNAEHLVPCQRS